jgi:hypothetical protein
VLRHPEVAAKALSKVAGALLERTLGFRLFDPKDLATGLPQAVADSIRVPELGHDRD